MSALIKPTHLLIGVVLAIVAILWAFALLKTFGDNIGTACLIGFIAISLLAWRYSSARNASADAKNRRNGGTLR